VTNFAEFTSILANVNTDDFFALTGLSTVEFLLSLFDNPDLEPLTEPIARAVLDALKDPPALEWLCGCSFIAYLLESIAPKCDNPVDVFQMAANFNALIPDLAAEFLAASRILEFLDLFADCDALAQSGICLFLETLVIALPPEPSPASAELAALVCARVSAFPNVPACWLRVLGSMLTFAVFREECQIAAFNFSPLFARLLTPLSSDDQLVLLGLVLRLFQEGVGAAIAVFEWPFLTPVLDTGLHTEPLLLCKLAAHVLSRRPDLVPAALESGLGNDLLRITDNGTFHVKKWVFKTLEALVEVCPSEVIPLLGGEGFGRLLADLADASDGELRAEILGFLGWIAVAAPLTGAPIGGWFCDDELIAGIAALEDGGLTVLTALMGAIEGW
jgi:hypothetical protein